MGVFEFAVSMRARMPWMVAQRILSSIGLPRGRGWEKTLGYLRNCEPASPGAESEIENALVEHYRCGEKAVRLFQVGSERRKVLRERFDHAKIGQSVFLDFFPLLVPLERLSEQPTKPVLISVDSSDAGTIAVFASVRTISVREVVDRTGMPQPANEELAAYDQIIGVRHIRHQAMDVLWIPSTGKFIELRVDYPKAFHRDAVAVAIEQFTQRVKQIAGEDFDFSKPVNLFPLIQSMYSMSNEGTIVELAFGTSTGSMKHERMRRRQLDLRTEVYHQGGKKALGTAIEPHQLSVVWSRHSSGHDSTPELSLNASVRTAGSTSPALYLAEIRNCTNESDYDFVRSRIMAHLT